MTDLASKFSDLDGLLAGPEPDYDTEPEAPRDADDADRMLRKLARFERELDDVTEVATAQRARIDLWETSERDRIGKRMAWYQHALAQYHRSIIAHGGPKTLNLPNGTLRAAKAHDQWVYEDTATFLEWAASSVPDVVRTRQEIDKNAVKKLLTVLPDGRVATSDGDIVPGLKVETNRGDTFRQEVKK